MDLIVGKAPASIRRRPLMCVSRRRVPMTTLIGTATLRWNWCQHAL